MPLNPSGKTPTSSPARSAVSALAGAARICPLLRARADSSGISSTRSALSTRRVRRAVLKSPDLYPEPALVEEPGDRYQDARGEFRLETELIHRFTVAEVVLG